jgi:hypothetical protein
VNVVHNLLSFLHFGYDKFCVVFAVLISVEYFVGSCYFWIFFVLVPSLWFFSPKLVKGSTVYRCGI